jgi:4a-hydroxytetrahydrobiopterin dehydratase
MKDLLNSECEACRADAPGVSATEAKELLQQIPEWEIEQLDDMSILEREYTFKNFVAALEFTNKVGELAEAANHHPVLVTEWGKVTVEWWTHKIKGLHKNDFVMAAKTERLYSSLSGE